MKLEYYVYYYNFNSHLIKKFNIFNHGRFLEDVMKDLRECETKKEFAEKLHKDLIYYFWSKAEWEVVITPWTPYITISELNRLNEERKKEQEREIKIAKIENEKERIQMDKLFGIERANASQRIISLNR